MKRRADMRRKNRFITYRELQAFQACAEQRAKFRQVFGQSAVFSIHTALILYDKFSFTWLPNMLEAREADLYARANGKLSRLRDTSDLEYAHDCECIRLKAKYAATPTPEDIHEWHRIKCGHRKMIKKRNDQLSEARAVLAMRYWLRYGPRAVV